MIQIKSRYRKISKLFRLASSYTREFGFSYFLDALIYEFKKNKLNIFAPEPEPPKTIALSESEEINYKRWLSTHQITTDIKQKMEKKIQQYLKKPKISIVLSISSTKIEYLKETLTSIQKQIYDNWEISFVLPTSIKEQVNGIINDISDLRIIDNFKQEQGDINDISYNTSGEFITFVTAGDILTEDALFRVVELLNDTGDTDIIYSDEDAVDQSGTRIEPFFKPDWSPDLFLSLDYVSHFFVVKNSIFKKCGGFRDQFEDAKHYDLLLRLVEITDKIAHIKTIVVSIRVHQPSSTFARFGHIEPHVRDAILETLKRRRIKGEVTSGLVLGSFRIKYFLDTEPKVSIIIPTRDNETLLKRCIKSIEKNTRYRNYEIIIVDNNSIKKKTISYIRSLRYKTVKYTLPFNFSKINNLAVSYASGEYLLFMNDDVAVLEPEWLSEMISIAQQENVGIVGPKLVLIDNTIQHAGLTFLQTGAGFHPLQGIDSDSPGYFGCLNTIRNSSAVTGACLLINKKIFEQVGGFDEAFDVYYGDADLCLKVLNHGYKIIYTPYARLLHQGSASIKEQSSAFFAVENHQTFIKKWSYLKYGDPFYNPNFGLNYKINI